MSDPQEQARQAMEQAKQRLSGAARDAMRNTTPAAWAGVAAVGVLAMVGLALWRRSGGGGETVLKRLPGRPVSPHAGTPLDFVRQQVLGLSRRAVAELFGSPAAAGGGGRVDLHPGRGAMRLAKTWFYIVQGADRTAMAVEFDEHGRARDATFFRAPIDPERKGE